MARQVQNDISQSRRETKKVMKHEAVEEVCEENKCRELVTKQKRIEEADK